MRSVVLFILSLAAFGANSLQVSPKQSRLRPETSYSTEIGNGGDLVQCHPDNWLFPYPFFNGWYMLDYAEFIADPAQYHQTSNLIKMIHIVRAKIAQVGADHLNRFDDFLNSVPFINMEFEVDPLSRPISRQWKVTHRNVIIQDEGDLHISPSCRLGDNDKEIRRHQIVVRIPEFDENGMLFRVTYSFDSRLMARLRDKPLQLSMLIIHEWLWDYFVPDDSMKLRVINRQIHQERSFPSDFLETLPPWLGG